MKVHTNTERGRVMEINKVLRRSFKRWRGTITSAATNPALYSALIRRRAVEFSASQRRLSLGRPSLAGDSLELMQLKLGFTAGGRR